MTGTVVAAAALGPDEGWEDVDWDFPTCPVNECGRRVPRQRIFCSSHWRLVEHEIRRAIYDPARVLNNKAAPPEDIVVA